MTQAETQDEMQAALVRLEKAINRLEVAAGQRLKGLAALKSQEVDMSLFSQDRQALAEALDQEKAGRELSEKLRAQALEKVEGAMELVRSVIYEIDAGANR